MFSTFSDPYLNFAFWTGLTSTALTLLLVLLIIGLRWRRLRQERHEHDFIAAWLPVLMRMMMSEQELPLPALQQRDHWLFLKLWNQFQESIRGDAAARLGHAAYRLGCQQMARRLLTQGGRVERLFAILTLGHMRDRQAWELLLTELHGPGNTAPLYAARALIQIDPPQAVAAVVPLILQRDDWELVQIATLLQRFKDVLGTELLRHLRALPDRRLLRALRLAEALNLQVDATVLLPWLSPEQPIDKLIACLRLASGPLVLDAVRGLASHDDWRVRVQVARALGRLSRPADVPLLTSLLSDPQWWVRYRAAQSLAGLPFLDRRELRALMAQQSDRYAREIFIQVLAEVDGGAA